MKKTKLEGEWVLLPKMKWPEALPSNASDFSPWETDRDVVQAVYMIWLAIMGCRDFCDPKIPRDGTYQKAYAETLVRLGYTEDVE